MSSTTHLGMVSLAPIEMVIFWGMVNMALFYPHEFKFSWIQPARHAKSSVSRFGFAGLWAGTPKAKVLKMAEIPVFMLWKHRLFMVFPLLVHPEDMLRVLQWCICILYNIIYIHTWLVVWNILLFFHTIWVNPSHWLVFIPTD